MANALSERGYKVRIVCCDEEEGVPDFPLNPNVSFENYGTVPVPWTVLPFVRKIRALNIHQKKRKLNRSRLFSAWQAEKIRSAITKQKTDIYICFQASSTYILSEIFKVSEPIVTMFHGHPRAYTDGPSFAIHRQSVEKSAALQVLLPEFMSLAREVMPDARLVYIPNAITPSNIRADLGSPRIIHVGRLDPRSKRQDLLIKAFGLVADCFPSWSLEIWGDTISYPEYVKYIRNLVRDLNLESRIFFRGVTDCIEEKLQRASIFALPSSSEGFSMALGEAMSVGLPVAGCLDCVSVRSVVSSGSCGVLTDPTPEAFAEGLATLMRDESARKRMGLASLQNAKNYAPDVVWGQWDSLIRSLITRKGDVA